MKWQNKVQLIGYLGKEPHIRVLPSGYYYAVFRLATNSGFTSKTRPQITTWHTVKLWGRRPDYIQNFFMKGSHVLVDGQICHKSFQDSSGQTRHITEIKADRVMNLDR